MGLRLKRMKWIHCLDIIVTNEYFREKLIFTNSKNQKNTDVYQKVLDELKKRAETRGEAVPYTAI